MILYSEEWHDEDYRSRRWRRAFAFWPTKCLDNTWVWLNCYWIQEQHSGWGFVDNFPYYEKVKEHEVPDGHPL